MVRRASTSSRIRIEPCRFSDRRSQLDDCHFTLDLPLVDDGRMALGLLRAHSAAGAVEHCRAGAGCFRGILKVVDNVCRIVWTDDPHCSLPKIRVSGDRFTLGDVVCLRPDNGPLRLFRVCRSTRVQAPHASWREAGLTA
jgi:hypothetical protein